MTRLQQPFALFLVTATALLALPTACSSTDVGSTGDGGATDGSAASLDGGRADASAPDTGSSSSKADVGTPDVGSPDVGEPPDAGTDAATTSGSDGGAAVGVQCGSQFCGPGDSCCAFTSDAGTVGTMCMTGGCPDGGLGGATCDGPEDCPSSSSSICCATIQTGAGSFGACPIQSVNAGCQSVCNSALPFSCSSTYIFRACHVKSDCAADTSGFTECCLFKQGTDEYNFCIPSFAKSASFGCAP